MLTAKELFHKIDFEYTEKVAKFAKAANVKVCTMTTTMMEMMCTHLDV